MKYTRWTVCTVALVAAMVSGGPGAGAQEPDLQQVLQRIRAEKAAVEREMEELSARRQVLDGSSGQQGAMDIPVRQVQVPQGMGPTREAPRSLRPTTAPFGRPLGRHELLATSPEAPPRLDADALAREVTYGDAVEVGCLVSRVCLVSLERGEVIVSRALGDTERWSYQESTAGPVGAEVPVLLLSPRTFDLETNLLVLTDRRIYRIELRSLEEPKAGKSVTYHEATAIVQPIEDVVDLFDEVALSSILEEPPSELTVPEPVNTAYRIEQPPRRSRLRWTPVRVFDDGGRVWIQLPEQVAIDGIPVVQGVDPYGERHSVDSEVQTIDGTRWIIVARLVHGIDLVEVSGDRERSVRIRRDDDGAKGAS